MPHSIFNHTQMDGIDPAKQAIIAIRHVLMQIKTRKDIAFQLGLGTQSFSLLTEAFAALTNQALEDVRKDYLIQETK